jgi:hypothetical protein
MATIQEIHQKMLLQPTTKEAKQNTTIEHVPHYHDREKLRIRFLERLNTRIVEKSDGKKSLILNDEISNVIELVCQHLNNEPEFEQNDRWLNRGLFLGGHSGSGKTEIMLTYRDFKQAYMKEKFGYKTCTEINEMYKLIDPDTMKISGFYALKPFIQPRDEAERFFDDLGEEETTLNDYGNKIAPMPYIFNERYKNRMNCGKTHATSNLSKGQLLEKYGSRFESRIHEQFNFIGLGTSEDSIDHRKT